MMIQGKQLHISEVLVSFYFEPTVHERESNKGCRISGPDNHNMGR